jgi:hypothetical protein
LCLKETSKNFKIKAEIQISGDESNLSINVPMSLSGNGGGGGGSGTNSKRSSIMGSTFSEKGGRARGRLEKVEREGERGLIIHTVGLVTL